MTNEILAEAKEMFEQAKRYYLELRASNCSDWMLASAEGEMIEAAKHLEDMRIRLDKNRTFPVC